MTLCGLTSSTNAKCMFIVSSSNSSISSFWGRGRGVGVESGEDLCLVQVIKCNVIYYKSLSLVFSLPNIYVMQTYLPRRVIFFLQTFFLQRRFICSLMEQIYPPVKPVSLSHVHLFLIF